MITHGSHAFLERISASIALIWNIVASRPKLNLTPTVIFCIPICPNNYGEVFFCENILVFEKLFSSFDRSNMQISTVNSTRVVWPRVTNILNLRYFCQHAVLCHRSLQFVKKSNITLFTCLFMILWAVSMLTLCSTTF